MSEEQYELADDGFFHDQPISLEFTDESRTVVVPYVRRDVFDAVVAALEDPRDDLKRVRAQKLRGELRYSDHRIDNGDG